MEGSGIALQGCGKTAHIKVIKNNQNKKKVASWTCSKRKEP